MKAVLLTAPLQVELGTNLPEPVCGPYDVVVQMRGVGLCGSDLSVYEGHRAPATMPWVMGHEGGGEIVAVGAEVRHRQVGEHVVIEPNYPCLNCPACRLNVTSACSERRIVGMDFPGLLAERVAVPAQFVLPVPDSWPDEVLACFEPTAVARAAVRRSGVRAGQHCLVIGAGSQGLLVCQALLALGAVPVVTEPHAGRLALARAIGVEPATAGEVYQHVFETAGPPAAFSLALRSAAVAGTVTLIGLSQTPVAIETFDLVRRGLTLKGSIIYDHPGDFLDTRDAIAAGQLRPERIVNAGSKPRDAANAFAEARSMPGKSWIDLTAW